MTAPAIVQADHAMLAAAMRAKAGQITKGDVIDLIERVASLMPHDLRRRAAVRAFANRILLMSIETERNCTFAGAELHDFLIENGERMAAE